MTPPLVAPGVLTLGCVDVDAPPLFSRIRPDGVRPGYEPEAAAAVAAVLGVEVRWVPLAWSDFYPAVDDGRVDAIWCGQGMTDARRAQVDFTAPYAIFDESLVVGAGVDASGPDDLRGMRIGAIAASTNMALAETFAGVETVAFPGTERVFEEMVEATRTGAIDGFVDDDVVMVPLDDDPALRLAFTLPTRNRWGIAVTKGNDALREALDAALAATIADGTLEAAWRRTIPWLPFPLPE